MHMVEKILNNTGFHTGYGKIRASHEGSLHSSTLIYLIINLYVCYNMVPSADKRRGHRVTSQVPTFQLTIITTSYKVINKEAADGGGIV